MRKQLAGCRPRHVLHMGHHGMVPRWFGAYCLLGPVDLIVGSQLLECLCPWASELGRAWFMGGPATSRPAIDPALDVMGGVSTSDPG